VAAARLARHEIDLFGSVQLALLIGVLLWVFRSGRLLALSAAALGLGMIAAFLVCRWVFGSVHVLTLVFCSNLAGVAIDYSLYYSADQFRAPGRWNAADALRSIGPAITMCCVATVMSYALLAVAPFPGLRQMALFCCVGLAVAYGCVMAWFPPLLRPARWHTRSACREYSAAPRHGALPAARVLASGCGWRSRRSPRWACRACTARTMCARCSRSCLT